MKMAIRLPIVKVKEDENKLFFFDTRLRELRAVDNPFVVIRLNDFEVEHYKGKENQICPAVEILKQDEVHKFGNMFRLVKVSREFLYLVECNPFFKNGKTWVIDEENWTTLGGSVGMSTSEFKTKKEAEQFYNDILRLSHEEMTRKYPNLWVE